MAMSNPGTIIKFGATDTTSALSAELFIREHYDVGQYLVSDPAGEQCFITLVDVIINAEACLLTLPSAVEYGRSPLLIERLHNELKRVPESAAVKLSRETEDRIFEGFTAFITDNMKRAFLARWLGSQFLNPIIDAQHHARLGQRARNFIAITDEGRDIWEARAADMDASVRAQMIPLCTISSDMYAADIELAGGIGNFQYSYAFDVYRRGWQYADKCRQSGLEITYCPHAFRQAALDSGSPDWLEQTREYYWSWGRCLAHLVKSHHPTLEQVVEWILSIKEAKPPQWRRFPPADEDRDAARMEMRQLIEMIESVATSAKLPKSQLLPLGILWKPVEATAERLREQLELGTICKLLEILGAMKVVDTVGFHLGEAAKDAINIYYRRGAFGYKGLVGRVFETRAASRANNTYLL
jgi:hypothetical protein